MTRLRLAALPHPILTSLPSSTPSHGGGGAARRQREAWEGHRGGRQERGQRGSPEVGATRLAVEGGEGETRHAQLAMEERRGEGRV